MVFKLKHPEMAAHLFQDWQESMIWSCLQSVMGQIYAVSGPSGRDTRPVSAMTLLGDFCFFAGNPDEVLVRYKPEGCKQDFIIMTPQNESWATLIEECYKEKARKVKRYAIKKEADIFDMKKLQEAVASLPSDYTFKLIDEELYNRCKQLDWCRDWVSQYSNYAEYQALGLGVVILKDGEPVSGASSYSRYRDGIEVEIDTKEEYRKKGLAYISGAKLIMECLERGLYPSWDAQNLGSVALAEKLGYHFDHEYSAYEIWGY